ncbi:MAG: methylmalonyl-CoA mutase family protein [Myxococcota bacterium]
MTRPVVSSPENSPFSLTHRVRFVTAASLFDGHDAAIQIMRRILQAEGAEVIHLGHDRSVQEVVDAAICEDAQGIAISSYQGGHVEYFTYMLELLRERGAGHIQVYGGGGGVIVPDEIELLHARGVARIFSPEDGRRMGLVGMIRSMLRACDRPAGAPVTALSATPARGEIARALTCVESAYDAPEEEAKQRALRDLLSSVGTLHTGGTLPPVVGITGTGGAGKSSLIDELLLRFLESFPEKRVAVLSVDPTRRRTGGALLGDRIRMNAARNERVFVRSMATRRANLATSAAVKDSLQVLAASGFDLILLETAGIGQSDSEVTELCDLSMYVMTPEFGAPSQLEKIDMLDFADLVVVNKFDKRGAPHALRDVRKTYQRNHQRFEESLEEMPVFGTSAHRFHDPGTNAVFVALVEKLAAKDAGRAWKKPALEVGPPRTDSLIPQARTRYLAEIADTVRKRHQRIAHEELLAERLFALQGALTELGDPPLADLRPFPVESTPHAETVALRRRYNQILAELGPEARGHLERYDALVEGVTAQETSYEVRGRQIAVENYTESLSHQATPKVAAPRIRDFGARVRFSMKENLPGHYPYTAGVFPYKRAGEDPTRMFAGEGTPERTNRRFHYVSQGQPAVRLSTAFDSVTLYGADPDRRPDIYGKIGNSGVSVCCLDDAKRLYSGFDLCAPSTSVSMTINGPAPTVLAFFFNAAIDAACERKLRAEGRWAATESRIVEWFAARGQQRPTYRGELPPGHDGMGLGFLGLSADVVVERAEYEAVRAEVLRSVRGTVQADILKEDQAQNTCIFSTEFALRMMGDVQQYFIDEQVRNFYSVSISGYHIAEAGANPITQLAFTLANGFTLVEYYRARGMDVNAFAPNLSFFFSNGLDPEYAVIGRVARRIWAVAMKELYGADDRSQKLKYHIQTSGRSLHAQEIAFNDIRTTLQALYAIMDNCNSLHTNAYDEAITTPTEESVRRAIAIQLIINRELGLTKNENPLQGSHFIERLTDVVEEAVLKEFEALDVRGGVLGAMETMYQRGKIQDESLHYEHKKHSGELPIIGVNTYLAKDAEDLIPETTLIRSTEDEKRQQIDEVDALRERYPERDKALASLKHAATTGGNLFAALMDATKVCSLGAISGALYDVGGAYRRSM